MAYKAQILLGTITKAHGYEGAVTVRLEKAFKERIPEMESVFLEIEGKPVPFFITLIDYPGPEMIRVKFEGYESIHKVKEFTGCRIFLTSGAAEYYPDEDLTNLTGFIIYSGSNEIIGTILSIVENPGQVLLNVDASQGRKILIPLHENLIINIDRQKKIIRMDLPEGLTDLN